MKRLMTIIALTAILAVVGGLTIADVTMASDRTINTTIDQITVTNDKNGKEYVRVIATLPYELNGVKYSKSVPIMGFGAVGQQMKTMQSGDSLSAIVSESEYRGRTSCVVITLLE